MSNTRSLLFEMMNRVHRTLGRPLMKIGKSLYKSGVRLQGEQIATESLRPDPRHVRLGAQAPSSSAAGFVAPNTSVVGDVVLEEGAAVYYSSQLTAFGGGTVRIGKNAIIHDLVQVKATEGRRAEVGEGALVSSNALVLNSRVGAGAFVGLGARVIDSEVAERGVVAAGAVLRGARVAAGEVWAGSPARKLRDAGAEEADYVDELRGEYAKLNELLWEEEARGDAEVLFNTTMHEESMENEIESELYIYKVDRAKGLPLEEDDLENPEERTTFLEWANFIKRLPERRLPNMSEAHGRLPEHMNVHNPNLRFAERVEQSLEQKRMPDTEGRSRRPYSFEQKQNDRF